MEKVSSIRWMSCHIKSLLELLSALSVILVTPVLDWIQPARSKNQVGMAWLRSRKNRGCTDWEFSCD